MKSKTLKITLISIIFGLYIAFNFRYFSGVNPLFDIFLKLVILVIFISSVIYIFKEKNRKRKLIQFAILIICIGVGIFAADIIESHEIENSPRIYLYNEKE